MPHPSIHAAVDTAASRVKLRACVDAEPVVKALIERRECIGLRLRQLAASDDSAQHTCCDNPEGYLLEDGVSGTELRDGESSGFSRVCSWRPMVLETVEESGGTC